MIDSSFSGALGRVTGKNVNTYAYTLGNLSAGSNYSLALGGSSDAVNLGTAGSFAALGTAVTLNNDPIVTGDTGTDTDNATAYADFLTAYSVVEGKTVGTVTAGSLDGQNLLPGVYSFDNSNKTGTLTLNAHGNPDAVWIFKSAVATGYLEATSFNVVFVDGVGKEGNVFWWTDAYATLTTSTFKGTILSGDYITITGGTLTGRALATNAVTMTSNTVSVPESGSSASTFAITPKLLTVTATGVDKVYDRTTDATVILSDNRMTNDVLTIVKSSAFTDKNVGIGKTINVTDIAITDGSDAGNYTLNGVTTVTTDANIAKAPLTATITVDSKVYDGINSATILTRTLNEGVISGDIVTLNENGSANFDNKNVGINKPISTEGITLGGADAGNYSLTQPSLTNGVITPKLLTVTAAGVNKVYNGNDSATATLSGDKLGGDTVNLAYTTATFADKTVGTAKPVSVSGISITDGADKDNYTLNGVTTASATANITKAPLTATITASNKVVDGNTSATILTRTLVGVIGNDVVTPNADGTATFANADVGSHVVSAIDITLDGADKGNYSYDGKATGTADILATPTVVYVDDNWAGITLGADPDSTGPATVFGYDSFSTIQDGISKVAVGGTVNVAAGPYTEVGQIVINKNLSIVGADKTTTIIKPATDTVGNNVDSAAWFLVNTGITFNLSNVTLDGDAPTRTTNWAIASYGHGTIDNNIIKNIKGGTYLGRGVVVFGDTTVSNNTFSNIERIGVHVRGAYSGSAVGNATVTGNTYVGKGVGNWLDYGVEVGAGATAHIENNTISNAKGVASSDGSTSAGILVTDYYDTGTSATITGNTISNSTDGIAVGYDASDTSVVVVHSNKISGNTHGINSTHPAVNAENNWWGTIGGAVTAGNIGNVDYRPWCVEETCTTVDDIAPTITVSSLIPSDNAVGITPTSPTISATFNETIVAGNSDVELAIDNGEIVTATASFDDTTKKLTIVPSTSLLSNTKYQVTIKTSVADTAGNLLTVEKVWHFTTSASYSIALTTGWNLISLPVVPSGSILIEDVLGASASSINAVWAYDATTGWSVYRPSVNDNTNNLTTMTAGYGYWIDYEDAPTTSITGIGNLIEPGNSNIPERKLKEGWNLVGYYQRENTTDSTAYDAFANNLDGYWNESLLIGYNNSTKNLSYPSTVYPGEGFWILLNNDRIYTIGNDPNQY